MSARARRVQIVSSNPESGFVQADAALLHNMGHDVRLVSHLPWDIVRRVRGATHIICWLVAEHAFYAVLAARLFRRPSLLILGGIEGEPPDSAIGVSLWRRPWHVRARARWAIRNAGELWTVEPSLAERTFSHGRIPRRAYRVVHTVFDPARFRILPRVHDVVFACPSESPSYRRRKGLDAVLGAARRLPDVSFVVIGSTERAAFPSPSNVHFTGYVPLDEYARILGQARVVVNASYYEGLNNTLCEAMMSGAIPVVSDIPGNVYAVQGLPFARTFTFEDVDRLTAALREALHVAKDAANAAAVREFVLRRFPVETRALAFDRFLARAS